MSVLALSGALEAGLLYSLVALGVYLSFRVLNFPDLTVDGAFPLGGAVAATLIVAGWNPYLATALAALAGAVAGLVTAWLHVRLRIMALLAGILTMVALYSVNLRIMGRPNVSLYGATTIFSPLDALGPSARWATPLACLAVALTCKLVVDWFLGTELGLAMRATGENPVMARAQGVRNGAMILLGMAIGDGFVGLAGALFAQNEGVADISMGIGTIVVGLAALILGETLLPVRSVAWATSACIAGSLIYRFAVALALDGGFIGMRAQDLNLATAVLVALAVVLSKMRLSRQARPRPMAGAAVSSKAVGSR
jgi:putative tryptophan/tyrosine transport system permease protein